MPFSRFVHAVWPFWKKNHDSSPSLHAVLVAVLIFLSSQGQAKNTSEPGLNNFSFITPSGIALITITAQAQATHTSSMRPSLCVGRPDEHVRKWNCFQVGKGPVLLRVKPKGLLLFVGSSQPFSLKLCDKKEKNCLKPPLYSSIDDLQRGNLLFTLIDTKLALWNAEITLEGLSSPEEKKSVSVKKPEKVNLSPLRRHRKQLDWVLSGLYWEDKEMPREKKK